MALADSLLAFAGGAAQAYNTDVEKQREAERAAQKRAQELILNAQLRVGESMLSKDLDRQEEAYKLQETVRRLGGPSNPDAQAWYAKTKKGWSDQAIMNAFKNGEDMSFTVDEVRKPFDYAAYIADTMSAHNVDNDKLMRGINRQLNFRYGDGKQNTDFALDSTAQDIQGRLGQYSTEEYKNSVQAYLDRNAPAPTVKTEITNRGELLTAAIGPEGEILRTDKQQIGTPPPVDLKLQEASGEYLGPDDKVVKLLWSPVTETQYVNTDKGYVVANPSEYKYYVKGKEPSQRDSDYAEMTAIQDKLDAGETLDTKDQRRYTFLVQEYSTAIAGPTIKYSDGTEIQETYALHPLTGKRRNVSQFYQKGSAPAVPTMQQLNDSATQLLPILAAAKNGESGTTALEQEVAKRFEGMDKIDKNLIYTNAHVLADYYIKQGQANNVGYAMNKAFEEISQYYNPKTEKFNILQMYENIQQIIGEGQIDIEFSRTMEERAKTDPKFAPAWAKFLQAGRGVNRTAWQDFINENRPK